MKKLVLCSAILTTFLSYSAIAATPTAPGTWTGTYKLTGRGTPTCTIQSPATAILTTGPGTRTDTTTYYDGTLTLLNLENSNPQWQNTPVKVTIRDDASSVQITPEENENAIFQGAGGYNANNATINFAQNSTTTCSLELDGLVYAASQ